MAKDAAGRVELPAQRLNTQPLLVTLVGGVVVAVSLFIYQLTTVGLSVSTTDIGPLESGAYLTMCGILSGLVLAFIGLTRIVQQFASQRDSHNKSATKTSFSLAISQSGFWRVFLVSALSYGLLFGIISGSLVFDSVQPISATYGVKVPSVVPVICCGAIGQMPQLVVYLTDHLAVLIIPVNVVVLFAISWLVGLNASLAKFSYNRRPKGAGLRWIASLGAIVGLFTMCPSCAGFFLLSILSISGAAAFSMAISSLQTVFLVLGIPFLVLSPTLSLRRATDNEICTLSRRPSDN